MTDEEAIHYAECLKNNYTIDLSQMKDFCDMAIEALKCEQWIPYPENEPKEDGSYIVTMKDEFGNSFIAEDKYYFATRGFYPDTDQYITAYIKAPEPYKEPEK